jgi:hypothetical protein
MLTRNILLMFVLQVAPSCLCFCIRGMHPIFVLDWSDTSDSEQGMPIQFISDFLQPIIIVNATSCKASCFKQALCLCWCNQKFQVNPEELYVSA